MISRRSATGSTTSRWLAAAAAALLVAGLAWWFAGERSASGSASAVADTKVAGKETKELPPPSFIPAAQSSAAVSMSTATPESTGLSAEQLQQLRDTLADHPDREAEFARIVAYLRFGSDWQRFLERRATAPVAAETRALAQRLDADLDARLKNREVTQGEALQIKSALLEVLTPDAGARSTQLAQWREAQAAAAGTPAVDPRIAQFERLQAERVAAWQALPPAQRDARRLEAELEALRQSVFNAPPGGGATTGGARGEGR